MPEPDKKLETASPRRPDKREEESAEDRHLATAELMIGTAMIFIGFLNVLLSISGGFEINVFPLILYFAGMAIWAHAAIRNVTLRYTVVVASIVLALAFFHYGEVLFWHKQAVFWTTIALVGFFMFKGSKPPNP
jgi:hypothetical protein